MPGLAPATSFAANAQERVAKGGWFPSAYADFAQRMLAGLQSHAPEQVTSAADVAEAIFRSATDPDCPAVLPAGADAIAASLAAVGHATASFMSERWET